MLHARVSERQLAPAAAAANQAGEESIAMLWRTVVTAGGDIAADHRPDRLGSLPADIPFMDVRHQRQPVGSHLSADLHADAISAVSRRHRGLTIRIGAAVDRIFDHPVDGGVVGTSPSGVPIVLLHWEVEVMFVEPEQRLPRAAKLLHFVEHELDRLLNAKGPGPSRSDHPPSRSRPAR